MSDKSILILAPTQGEIKPFVELYASSHERIHVDVCGIGAIETAASTAMCIQHYRPTTVILAGIAGAYSNSNLKIGQVVVVRTEQSADMGSFDKGVYKGKFVQAYTCDINWCPTDLSVVVSNSVNCCGAPFISNDAYRRAQADDLTDDAPHDRQEAAIENMEGAAFFKICSCLGVRYMELRAVSNIVGEPFDQWQIPQATQNLARELNKILDEIKA